MNEKQKDAPMYHRRINLLPMARERIQGSVGAMKGE
jgi:hypothetical protein